MGLVIFIPMHFRSFKIIKLDETTMLPLATKEAFLIKYMRDPNWKFRPKGISEDLDYCNC